LKCSGSLYRPALPEGPGATAVAPFSRPAVWGVAKW
jgi:hypothetical protein